MSAWRWCLVAIGVLAPGCRPACEGEACDCPEQRLAPEGTCCRGFSRPVETGCKRNFWDLPAEGARWGSASQAGVEVLVDDAGYGRAAWVTAHVGGTLEVAQEHDGGWSVHRPAQALQGWSESPSWADAAAPEDPEARFVLTWTQHEAPGAAVYALVVPPDVSSGALTQLSVGPTASQPHAAMGPRGSAVVTWNQWTGTRFGVAVATLEEDGDSWHRPLDATDVLSPLGDTTTFPRVALADNGDALVTWVQRSGRDESVRASERFRTSGAFPPPADVRTLSPTGTGIVGAPVAVLDRFGTAWVAWAQHDGADATAIYLAQRTGVGAWTQPVDTGDSFTARDGHAHAPQLALSAGEVHLVWLRELGEAAPQLLAAHCTADGVWDVSGQEPFAVSSAGWSAADPELAVGPDGEALVVWNEHDGTRWRVAARRRNAGAEAWGMVEMLSPDEEDATMPSTGIGATGRVVVGWRDGAGRIAFTTMD